MTIEAHLDYDSAKNGGSLRSLLEIFAVLGIDFACSLGNVYWGSDLLGLAGILTATAVAWFFLRREEGKWIVAALGRPRHVGRAVAWAVGISIVLVAAQILYLTTGSAETPDLSRFERIRGHLGMLLAMLVVSWVSAAFCEELLYRGFLMKRLARIFSALKWNWAAALVLSSVIFGCLHFYQGLVGVLLTGLIGFVLGVLFLVFGKNLWVSILVHGILNSWAFVVIYLSLDKMLLPG